MGVGCFSRKGNTYHTEFVHLEVWRRHYLRTAIAKRRSARVRQSRTGSWWT